MHEKNKYRHIPWNRYNLEKYRDINFWSYRPALEGSVRKFVVISTEHIVEIGQSQASVSLWWNVDRSNDDWWKFPGQIEWAADNGEMF